LGGRIYFVTLQELGSGAGKPRGAQTMSSCSWERGVLFVGPGASMLPRECNATFRFVSYGISSRIKGSACIPSPSRCFVVVPRLAIAILYLRVGLWSGGVRLGLVCWGGGSGRCVLLDVLRGGVLGASLNLFVVLGCPGGKRPVSMMVVLRTTRPGKGGKTWKKAKRAGREHGGSSVRDFLQM